jgi:hypothetical protein
MGDNHHVVIWPFYQFFPKIANPVIKVKVTLSTMNPGIEKIIGPGFHVFGLNIIEMFQFPIAEIKFHDPFICDEIIMISPDCPGKGRAPF